MGDVLGMGLVEGEEWREMAEEMRGEGGNWGRGRMR